jgi:hypothetical protein
MTSEIVTDCHNVDLEATIGGDSDIGNILELPVAANSIDAEKRASQYVHLSGEGPDAHDPVQWLINVRADKFNGGTEHLDWPAVIGGVRDIVKVADLFERLRSRILSLKPGDYMGCANTLYEIIPAKYEYIAGYREFWTLLAVYVIPEWPFRNFGPNMSPKVLHDRYSLKGTTATRDTLAQFWWKYHIMTLALGRAPRVDEWNDVIPDAWQERTNLFKNQDLVKSLAIYHDGLGRNSAQKELAKNVGKQLFLFDSSTHVQDALTAARIRRNVESDEFQDGLMQVRSGGRLVSYEKALDEYLRSGLLPAESTPEGASLLALAALGGYRLNRGDVRERGVYADTPMKVLNIWKTLGAEYVFDVLEKVRQTVTVSYHSAGVQAGNGYFVVGDAYTRTEIMAAGLDSYHNPFIHWAEGSWVLGRLPLLIGNQDSQTYPGEYYDENSKTVQIHSEANSRQSNSGNRYLTTPTLLFWCNTDKRFTFLGLGSCQSQVGGPHKNMLITFTLP